MKASKVLVALYSIITFSSIFCSNYLQKSLIYNQNFQNIICKIANDVIRACGDTQDILIGNLFNQVWSPTTKDIIRCIDDGSPVVITDFMTRINENNLRKASVVILMFNRINLVSDYSFI